MDTACLRFVHHTILIMIIIILLCMGYLSIVQCVLLEHILLVPIEIAPPARTIVLALWPGYVSVLAIQATTEQRLGRRTCHVHVSISYITLSQKINTS